MVLDVASAGAYCRLSKSYYVVNEHCGRPVNTYISYCEHERFGVDLLEPAMLIIQMGRLLYYCRLRRVSFLS